MTRQLMNGNVMINYLNYAGIDKEYRSSETGSSTSDYVLTNTVQKYFNLIRIILGPGKDRMNIKNMKNRVKWARQNQNAVAALGKHGGLFIVDLARQPPLRGNPQIMNIWAIIRGIKISAALFRKLQSYPSTLLSLKT